MKRKRHKTDDPARLLSERLNSAFRRPGEADWLDVRRRAGENEAPARWSRRRVLLVAGVLVLAAGAYAGSSGVIPWLDRKPAKLQAPPLAPPCKAKDLFVRLGYDVSLNGLSGSVSLLNTSRRKCSLVGRPRLALVDPDVSERRLLVEFAPPKPPKPGSVDLAPLSLLRAVPPHRGAYLHFSWTNWCEPGPSPAGLELRLPNGDRVVRSFSAVRLRARGLPPLYSATAPRCYRERWRTKLDYGSFYPSSIPASVISTYQMDATLPLRMSIITKGLPTIRKKRSGGRYYVTYVRVRRGSVFHYRVALRNTSKLPFRFKRCPLYTESIAAFSSNPPTQEIFVLNCRPVGVMAPGEVAFFAMEILVPKDAPLGWNVMTWGLYAGESQGVLKPVWIVP